MARIVNRSKFILPLVAASLVSMACAAQAADCLAYGGPATLDGWLSLKPATAAQITAGVAKNASLWSLKLAKPACVTADATSPAVAAAPRIALAVPADQDKTFRAEFGKKVKVTGTIRATDAAKAGYAVVLDGAKLAP
jgi:hypothetical protein